MKPLFAICLLCTSVACGGPANDPLAARSPSRESVARDPRLTGRDALFTADAQLTQSIRTEGPARGLFGALRADAVYVTPGMDIVQGKENVLDAVPQSAAGNGSVEREVVGGDVSTDGLFGFTFGWTMLTAADGTQHNGTYLATWMREESSAPFRVAAYYARLSRQNVRPPVRAGFPLLLDGAGAGGVPEFAAERDQEASLLATDAAFSARSAAAGYSQAFDEYGAAFAMPFGGRFIYLEGAAEIADAYSGWTSVESLTWTPAVAGSSPSGDLGFTVGRAVYSTTLDDGTPYRENSKYLTIWVREADGSWRYIADGGAASP